MIRKVLSIFILLAVLSFDALADHLSSSLLFTARMHGDNEVPAVATDGEGVASFTFDQNLSTLYVNVSMSGLSGPISGIHIHEAVEGENGPVIINLTPFLNGNRLKGTIRNFTRDQFTKMLSGQYYINAHTDANPGGEIRGQIRLETDQRFTAVLSGANEVPAIASDGQGLMIATLSGNQVKLHMVFRGLSSGLVGAHIHNAPAGENGPVIADLDTLIFGNVIDGTWDPTGFLDALMAGELYVNVHTENNPGGEIRGQLVMSEGLWFDALLDGDNEVPSIETSGRGVGMINVSPDLTQITYYILYDSLSSAVTGSHFHSGIAGANGGVLIDLSDDINGNIISGTKELEDGLATVRSLLEGGLYLNVHTENNPGGEIRGQVYKLAREGYVFDMSGGQEVPPVSTLATGAGIVSIDRDNTNAHYMIVYNNLQGTFTASHFHNAPPGENGGVLFDISSEYSPVGSAYGYWDVSDTPAFDGETSALFRENEIYINVHSDMHPSGEIRGNILRVRNLFTEEPFDPEFINDLVLVAELDGSQEEPPVTTDGRGLATVYLNEDRTSALVNVTVSSLSGPITGAHIHDGVFGENGPVIFPLTNEGNRIQMEITGITTEQLGKLLGGAYYINIHTAENPAGEIRGQIFIEQDLTFVATMSGDNEVPAVTTDAVGLGVFHYAIGQLELDVNVQFTGLSSNLVGAHLHTGIPGENGPVAIDLADMVDGNTIRGKVNLTLDHLGALFTNGLYVNVHTANNPGGEIRGQLLYQDGLGFDGLMSGLQESPVAVTAGTGLAVATVSNDLTNVEVWMVSDNLTGTVGASHFHMGAIGVNGGVVLDLSGGVNDNNIHFTGPISEAVVSALLTGDIYINAHTPAYPAGEIRGQMIRLARDPYAFDMCTEQEIGVVNAPSATGSGLVTIGREHSNVNLYIATTGLTGPVTAAHLHLAPAGQNGDPIVNLSTVIDEGFVSGAGIPADTSFINVVRDGLIYVNVHTDLHPAGELRGQVVKENLCELPTGINELEEIIQDVTLAPVPVQEILYVTLNTHIYSDLSMSVLDLSGKLLSTQLFQLTAGKNNVHVETDNLSHGFYILMISNGNAAQAYKFVK